MVASRSARPSNPRDLNRIGRRSTAPRYQDHSVKVHSNPAATGAVESASDPSQRNRAAAADGKYGGRVRDRDTMARASRS